MNNPKQKTKINKNNSLLKNHCSVVNRLQVVSEIIALRGCLPVKFHLNKLKSPGNRNRYFREKKKRKCN